MTTLIRFVIQLCLGAVALFSLGAGAAIVNTASTSYTTANGENATLRSNTVKVVRPDTITYYTSSDFTTVARATRTNGLLYVQIEATECDANPEAPDMVTVQIASTKTGDARTYEAWEVDNNSGIFRINGVARNAALRQVTVADSDDVDGDGDTGEVIGTRTEKEEGAIAVTRDDSLVARVNGCGSGEISTSILVDPVGIVYDSKTDQPLAGVTVTLIDVSGAGNGGFPGQPAIVFDVDGVTRVPSTLQTDAGGMYQFPMVAPSLYRLQVTPISNYSFPSKVKPGELPDDRTTNLYGSFGGEFVVSAATGLVTIDVPLDPIPGVLYLEKTASRGQVEVGDVLDYTIRVFNTAEQELVGVTVSDTLPAGFSYVPNTLRLDGAAVEAGFENRGPQLRIPVGTVPAKSNSVLRYRVRVGSGALQGDGINRAVASSAAPLALTSVVAAAKVKVSAGVFSEKGYILGQIFADCNANGLRDKGELGVPNVRVWLEDGSFSQTDADGRYSFADVSPRTHVAKVDPNTLPAGSHLAILSNRNAGDAGSRFVDLKDGELARADFALVGCSQALTSTIRARADSLRAAAKAAAELNAPAAAPQAAAKADITKLDNSLGFVDLVDGAVMNGTQATVRVKGTLESTVVLSVNGEPVGDDHVGERSKIAERQLEVRDFVGVTLRPGRNVLEASQRDAFGNPRGTVRITVVAPGALARVLIAPQSETAPADPQRSVNVRVKLEDAAGVPVAERTAVTLDATAGTWEQADLDPREPGLQVFVEGGSAEFALRAPAQAGEARLSAASGLLRADSVVRFVPDLRPLIAAGVVEGAFSLSRSNGNTSNPVRDFNGFEDRLRHLANSDHVNDGLTMGARAAMFAKGQVGDKTLLTMTYDSDKDTEPKLFRDINPLDYYPTYGDDARRGFEAQSTSRLFVRAERERSWIMYGDFVPPSTTPTRNLGAYTRNLTGLRQHAEIEGLTFDAFASYDSTRQMVEEIAANGTSGPFLTGGGMMVINSERVEIIVRDRNQTGVMLSRRSLVRYVDYDIEPLTGRILLRAPVPSLDPDLNPVSLRISYEVDQGSPRFWVGGVNAQYRVNDWIEVGAGYVHDQNPASMNRLASVNATVKPDARTTVIVEAAQMEKADQTGRAARIDATRNDGALESKLFFGRADASFDNPSSTLPKGRTEGGASARYRLDERTYVGLEALHTADLATDAKRNGVQVFGGYTFANGVQVEAGVRRAQEEAGDAAGNRVLLAQPDLTSVRAKVSMQIPGLPQAGVFAEAEQDVEDNGRRMLALGGDYRFAGGSRIYGRHELINSLGSTYALNAGQERHATVFGVDTDYMQDGRVFSEYRAGGTSPAGSLGGERQAEAALGLRNLWNLGNGMRASTSLERVKVLSGSAANESIAATGAIEVNRHPRWTGNARLEVRHGEDSDGLLNTLGLAYKIDETWTFLGKNTLAATRSRGSNTSRITELLQSGVAYRALESLGVNGLAKYEYKLERDNGPANLDRAVHAVSVNANWQPRRDTVLSARYAAKLARDRSNGYATRTVTHLVAGRATYEINEDWDIGATAQVLLDRDTRGRQYAAGVEAGYQLQKNMWVSAGYNLLGFTERDLAGADATAKGAFVRVRMKFDENTLQGLLGGNLMK